MADAMSRTNEMMMAELVHHMAELVKEQRETNRLLRSLSQPQPTSHPAAPKSSAAKR